MVDSILSGSGVAILGWIIMLIRAGFRDVKNHLNQQDISIGELRERVARLEGYTEWPRTHTRK